MSERDTYTDGEFCWVDLASPDVDASARFYGEMIGWEFQPVPVRPKRPADTGTSPTTGSWSPASAGSWVRASRRRG